MAGGIRKVVDERHHLPGAKGGGMLRREIWVDSQGRVVRYNLAYINPMIHRGDHGRVLGYDSAHGQHHRHYKGRVAVVSGSFEQIEARSPREWSQVAKSARHSER